MPSHAVSASGAGSAGSRIEFAKSGPEHALRSIETTTTVVDAKDSAAEFERIGSGHDQETLILSSDEPELIVEAAKVAAKSNGKDPHVFVLPIGGAGNPDNKDLNSENGFNRAARKFREHTVNSIRDDKIGFLVVTYSLGLETIRWVHASHLTNLEKSAILTYTVMTALVFSLNKDTWSNITKPIQRRIREVLKMSTVIPKKPGAADIVVKLAANIMIALPVNLARVPLLNIDEIANRSFDYAQLNAPIIMAFMGSMMGIAWGELVSSIDQELNPRAKFVARRAIEFRSLINGMFASTAMLMTFETYGMRPWVTMLVMGATGFALYLNSQKLIDWVEQNPVIARIHDSLTAIRMPKLPHPAKPAQVLNFPENLRTRSSAVRSCRQAVGD